MVYTREPPEVLVKIGCGKMFYSQKWKNDIKCEGKYLCPKCKRLGSPVKNKEKFQGCGKFIQYYDKEIYGETEDKIVNGICGEKNMSEEIQLCPECLNKKGNKTP